MTTPRSLRLSLAILGAATLATFAPARLSAQMVEAGVARDAKSGTPLECLHVALIDSAGRAVQHTVTNASGQFMLEARRPGKYRVQFLIFRWEPLVGPVDTLAEGAFKHRVYPLTFANMLVTDTSSVRQQGDAAKRDSKEKVQEIDDLLRADESYAGWQSRRAMRFSGGLHYPDSLFMRTIGGSVLARFIVDATGRARPASWVTLFATHPEFENAVKSTLPDARWMPAQNAGQAVCELVMDYTRFYTEHTTGNIVMVTR
ncbi:MAG TPA: hypothetical protein VF461_01860 [Gemmatimonadaceae bacterium]